MERVLTFAAIIGLLGGHAALAVDTSTQTSEPYTDVSMESGSSIAVNLNTCITKKLDIAKMAEFQTWVDGESIKIKKLCDEKKRDEALRAQEALAQALHEKEELKIIKACSRAAQATLSSTERKNFNAQSNVLLQKTEKRKHHPCDPLPIS